MPQVKQIIYNIAHDSDLKVPYTLNRLRWKAVIRKNMSEGKNLNWISNYLMTDNVMKQIQQKIGKEQTQSLISYLVSETISK